MIAARAAAPDLTRRVAGAAARTKGWVPESARAGTPMMGRLHSPHRPSNRRTQ